MAEAVAVAPEKTAEQKLAEAQAALKASEDVRRGLEDDIAGLEAIIASRNGTVTQLEFRIGKLQRALAAAEARAQG